MAYSTPPVNQFHATLRSLSEGDATFERAIAFGMEAIRLRGHDVVKADPGMFAWVMENQKELSRIAKLKGLH